MSQLGMQMPGGTAGRRASVNVYTGLLAIAAIALVAACVFVWTQAGKVGKGGKAFEMQDPAKLELKGG